MRMKRRPKGDGHTTGHYHGVRRRQGTEFVKENGVDFKPATRMPIPGDALGHYAYEGNEISFPPDDFIWYNVQTEMVGSAAFAEWNEHGFRIS